MILKIENLSKNYRKKEVLKDINFQFQSGKIYGLIGRNGIGKTTFFNCLTEEVEKNSGRFLLDQKELSMNEIGYVTTTPIVPEFLTGREFLQFYMDINEDKIKNKKTIEEYFDLVKIPKTDQNRLLKEYSHGMKNKMQILINIITNPKVILLDEPLTALDIIAQEEMKSLLKSLKEDHIIILSTHILELALDICDEVIVLRNKNLELLPKEKTSEKDYKEKMIQELKDDSNV